MAFFFLFGLFLVLAFIAFSAVVGFKLLIYGRAFLKSDFLSFSFGFLVFVLIFALNPILKNQNEVYRMKKSAENSRNYAQETLERELRKRFWEQIGRENNNHIEFEKRGGYLKSKTFRILCDVVNGRCEEKKNWLKNIIDKNCEFKENIIKSEYSKNPYIHYSAYCKTWINEEYFVDVKQICQKVNKIILSKNYQRLDKNYLSLSQDDRSKVREVKRDQELCQEFYKGKLVSLDDLYTK